MDPRELATRWDVLRGRLPIGAVALALLVFSGACRREQPLEHLWAAPSFELVDQQGRSFGSAELVARAAVLTFIYTHCTDTCPLLTATTAQVHDRLRA